MTSSDVLATESKPPGHVAGVRKTRWGRLVDSQTAIDFIGARKWGFLLSAIVIIATADLARRHRASTWASTSRAASPGTCPPRTSRSTMPTRCSTDNGLSAEGARIQERQSEATDFIKVQIADQPEAVGTEMKAKFAEAAGVSPDEVNVNLVSSSWGSEITDKALRALVIFLALVAVFISIRFEWRMAIAAILAMLHDVIVSVGIYSIFQFLVTPPTVIAFLTILGYSLYDTIVVFDRIRENETPIPRPEAVVRGRDQRLDEPGVDALDHDDLLVGDPRALDAGRRRVDHGPDDARGVRSGAADRPHHRCLLVAVHRRPAARVHEEDRRQLEDPHGRRGPRARRCGRWS